MSYLLLFIIQVNEQNASRLRQSIEVLNRQGVDRLARGAPHKDSKAGRNGPAGQVPHILHGGRLFHLPGHSRLSLRPGHSGHHGAGHLEQGRIAEATQTAHRRNCRHGSTLAYSHGHQDPT